MSVHKYFRYILIRMLSYFSSHTKIVKFYSYACRLYFRHCLTVGLSYLKKSRGIVFVHMIALLSSCLFSGRWEGYYSKEFAFQNFS